MSNLTEQQKITIRKRREDECFSIINRSVIWYNRLNSLQRSELETWYQLWLDAPETGKIPNTPTWINDKTKPEEILL